ncbi:hypothetical protein [Streptomyces sp. NPDC048623]|uniref:hypothetical protein n=1 Tax=Streptomyces sp. NPDC048623 TaxID=3155761 RepID=UPI003423EF7A
MSDSGRSITVTIKYGKGYDESWLVFKGRSGEVREDILESFGLDSDSVTGLTLSDIVVNATNIAHGKGLIATQLGATVIAEEPAAPAKPQGDPWANVGSTPQASSAWSDKPATSPEQDKSAWILGEIEKQTTRADLKKVWAANQSFFADPAVMDAYKVKGKSLPA